LIDIFVVDTELFVALQLAGLNSAKPSSARDMVMQTWLTSHKVSDVFQYFADMSIGA